MDDATRRRVRPVAAVVLLALAPAGVLLAGCRVAGPVHTGPGPVGTVSSLLTPPAGAASRPAWATVSSSP